MMFMVSARHSQHPRLHDEQHAIYIDMLGVPSLHHKHHDIYIDMLGLPSLHHEHHAINRYAGSA
jgi:hypothetical protein